MSKAKSRVHYVPPAEYLNLNYACWVVNKAYAEYGYGCYLVGSSIERPNYRDVDVRFIMRDEAFDTLFPDARVQPQNSAMWALTCTSIALFLQKQSGLPVDFQIQRMTEANEEYPNSSSRHPLGVGMLPNPPDYTFSPGKSDQSSSNGSAPGLAPLDSEK